MIPMNALTIRPRACCSASEDLGGSHANGPVFPRLKDTCGHLEDHNRILSPGEHTCRQVIEVDDPGATLIVELW